MSGTKAEAIHGSIYSLPPALVGRPCRHHEVDRRPLPARLQSGEHHRGRRGGEHRYDLFDRFSCHGSRGVTAASAEFLDQPLLGDPPRPVAERRFDLGLMLASSAVRNVTIAPLTGSSKRQLVRSATARVARSRKPSGVKSLSSTLPATRHLATQKGMPLAAAASSGPRRFSAARTTVAIACRVRSRHPQWSCAQRVLAPAPR